jgi:hypothetical protein
VTFSTASTHNCPSTRRYLNDRSQGATVTRAVMQQRLAGSLEHRSSNPDTFPLTHCASEYRVIRDVSGRSQIATGAPATAKATQSKRATANNATSEAAATQQLIAVQYQPAAIGQPARKRDGGFAPIASEAGGPRHSSTPPARYHVQNRGSASRGSVVRRLSPRRQLLRYNPEPP